MWPVAIIIAFVLFGGSVITAVVASFHQDSSLVYDDYYQKELEFQDQINKKILTEQLKKQLALEMAEDGSSISVTFPVEQEKLASVKGYLHFFRPSGAEEDFVVEISPDETGKQKVDLSGRSNGYWKLKADWKEGGLTFYHEEGIMI